MGLVAVYYNNGFVNVKVSETRDSDGSLYTMNEGQRYRLGEVSAKGQDFELQRETHREVIGDQLAPGAWFDRSKVGSSLLALTRHYRDQGYAL